MSSSTTFSGRDSHKRVTTKTNPGFLERLSDTAGGTFVGVGLFFLSIHILFTNEGRALRTASSLDEGLAQVVSLETSASLDLQNDNRLVHLSAPLHTSKPLHDPNYNVAVQAVKLKREVEMYQWVEYQESRDYQENGETKTETTYTYNTEWKTELINSRSFDKEIGHQNPSAMAVESVTVVAPQVQVGPFTLSQGLVEKINNFQTLSLKDLNSYKSDPFFTISDDYFYHTRQPKRPEVGDVRVQFFFAGTSGDTISVVAKQKGEKLLPFKTKSGDVLEILYLDDLSAEEVFAKEQQSNSMKTWGLRAAGWALMFLAIQLTMRIIYTLVDWVPILRDLVSVGLKIFALCVSSSLSLLTIAAGWFFYRPLMAAALGALAFLPMLLARSKLPAKKEL
ncbi:transmembrane protein 43 [Corythoichthys intestinalis]|uniref:transmembrane protein 43 n=1 Tax=Corythoichthys intestinalis TaxID=161448 RepID=UPI0025A635FD|nr:transmembrane protein 43 [Corythoichthys intestinalis]XP_061814420.1 transmembrane protein 43 [Nerophis lumbriciformis]